MNISQIVGQLLGEFRPKDLKTLELRVGQMVKGILLQWLNDREAMVNINGIPIKARIDADLKKGQMTFFQVQRQTADGQIFLKPLGHDSHSVLTPEMLEQFLKDHPFKDSPAMGRILQEIHSGQIPPTRENIQKWLQVLPPGAKMREADEWMAAFKLAFHRGIPLEKETVGALRQVLYGKPLLDMLRDFSAALSRFGERTPSPKIRTLAAQWERTIGRLKEMLAQKASLFVPEKHGMNEKHDLAVNDPEAGNHPGMRNHTMAGKQDMGWNRPENSQPHKSLNPSGNMGEENQRNMVGSRREIHVPLAWERLQGTTPDKSGMMKNKGPDKIPTEEAVISGRFGVHPNFPDAARPAGKEDFPWILKWTKMLGLDYERQLARQMFNASPMTDSLRNWKTQGALESVKGLLLSLSASEELSPALKEQVSQLLSHLTGQQLLLASDRTAQFAYFTFMLPFRSEKGEQNAVVHLQSRRGKGGRIDADNCRLWFDLTLDALGKTHIDVGIVNRMVNVDVYSDYSRMDELLDIFRKDLLKALGRWGYQLMGMKSSPLPQKDDGGQNTVSESSPTRNGSHFKPYSYKGMDVRV